MALAGFGSDEIELIQQGNILTVSGQKRTENNEGMLHQGLAFRNFKHSFNLADHVKVASQTSKTGCFWWNWSAKFRSSSGRAELNWDRRLRPKTISKDWLAISLSRNAMQLEPGRLRLSNALAARNSGRLLGRLK
jgi:hypothetical protein